jgi:hypothetical protein
MPAEAAIRYSFPLRKLSVKFWESRLTIQDRLKHCLRCAKLFEITPRVRPKKPVRELRRVIESHP